MSETTTRAAVVAAFAVVGVQCRRIKAVDRELPGFVCAVRICGDVVTFVASQGPRAAVSLNLCDIVAPPLSLSLPHCPLTLCLCVPSCVRPPLVCASSLGVRRAGVAVSPACACGVPTFASLTLRPCG